MGLPIHFYGLWKTSSAELTSPALFLCAYMNYKFNEDKMETVTIYKNEARPAKPKEQDINLVISML
ncbi:hypothetical protein FACS189467_5650 [Bacteroidia bacterium]|nr:hypothetical protein FACS189467_5650 [Bacteroidia bacterium]